MYERLKEWRQTDQELERKQDEYWNEENEKWRENKNTNKNVNKRERGKKRR